MESGAEPSENVEQIVMFTIREEKQAAARDLLVMLVVAGVAIEIAVVIVSYLMAEQAIRPVREAYDAQKIFIANASHEIKTPLAAIAANLEAADLSDNKWIANVELEAAKLTKLNSELLTLARTDLVSSREVSEVDIDTVAHGVVKSFKPRMKNINFTQRIAKSGKVRINEEDFEQILSILMDNAVKYAGSKIRLQVEDHTLILANDGAKIPPDKLPHIFERFYQADKTAEGVGLGLSIAKSLAERNHWKLSVESGKMVKFTLSF